MIQEEMKGWTIEQLIESFENDIFDAHQIKTRIDCRELFRRGKEALSKSIEHLRKNDPKGDLKLAWGILFYWWRKEQFPETPSPDYMRDIPGWIQWAEKVVAA